MSQTVETKPFYVGDLTSRFQVSLVVAVVISEEVALAIK